MANVGRSASPTKCPVCGTKYGTAAEVFAKDTQFLVEECGGEGNCPAREAGPRPTPSHVLCACNRRWLASCSDSTEGHAFEHCITSTGSNDHSDGSSAAVPADGGIQEDEGNQGGMVRKSGG